MSEHSPEHPNDRKPSPDERAGQSSKLWGGRFNEATDAFVQRFTASVGFDQRLAAEDIAGSLAHARMLTSVGVLSPQELKEIESGLAQVQQEIAAGNFQWSVELEDVDGPVDDINSHGTSTPAGDITELKAIAEVFGDEIPRISSTKSLSGHSLGATGVHEAIYTLLMMEDDFIAASANIETLDAEAEGMPIALQRQDNAGLQRVMSNSFGFGGTNASLVFQRLS